MAELREKIMAKGILVGVLSKYLDNKPTYYRFCQVIIGYIFLISSIISRRTTASARSSSTIYSRLHS